MKQAWKRFQHRLAALTKRLVPQEKRIMKRYGIALGFAAGILLTLLAVWAVPHLSSLSFHSPFVPSYPEVQELTGVHYSFQEYQTYFQKLADKKGAVYAFEVLKRAPFPPGVDLHLLGHVVGDMLYKQKGLAGIGYCTQDFRNACSHSVVIGYLEDHGPSSFPQIVAACKQAPGGKGAYTMCFHGLGHGVLAYNGYDLKKAVAMCKLAGTPEYHDQEYVECVGGTIMEMIAGVHDRATWEKQVKNYFKDSDPLYPCDANWMPDEVRSVCYIQLTPHLFQAANGDLGNLNPDTFPKAFSFCNAIPTSDTALRGSCFGGFGKEFTVVAQGHDIRDMGNMTEPQLRTVRQWCAYAKDDLGEEACDSTALASLFWGGENKADASFTFCSIADGHLKDACYHQLATQISYYLGDARQGGELCTKLPSDYQSICASHR